jgi:hypothetical protein
MGFNLAFKGKRFLNRKKSKAKHATGRICEYFYVIIDFYDAFNGSEYVELGLSEKMANQ